MKYIQLFLPNGTSEVFTTQRPLAIFPDAILCKDIIENGDTSCQIEFEDESTMNFTLIPYIFIEKPE